MVLWALAVVWFPGSMVLVGGLLIGGLTLGLRAAPWIVTNVVEPTVGGSPVISGLVHLATVGATLGGAFKLVGWFWSGMPTERIDSQQLQFVRPPKPPW